MDILSGLAVLAIGVLIGVAISQWVIAQSSRTNTLSRQLDEVHAEYAAYQDKVDQHFRKTADLLNALSSNYGAIHQHLALGVQTLSQRNLHHVNHRVAPLEGTVSPTEATHLTHEYQEDADVSTERSSTETPSPPKDYALKNANDPGMLSEEYPTAKKAENKDAS